MKKTLIIAPLNTDLCQRKRGDRKKGGSEHSTFSASEFESDLIFHILFHLHRHFPALSL